MKPQYACIRSTGNGLGVGYDHRGQNTPSGGMSWRRIEALGTWQRTCSMCLWTWLRQVSPVGMIKISLNNYKYM